MAIKDAHNTLEHLKKEEAMNTFGLSRELGIDKHKVLDIIKTTKFHLCHETLHIQQLHIPEILRIE